eukprot:TRINITY_DN91056_c0_g1_i1.p1 TRINITY_DN91056_c0_g1~~TRINITY_DN91056_c0_g1_i1.p1  ORF type:complete len:294 (-),score=-5.15 TRINITY_DN91056_c0_g1_i1:161-1042(-)
MYYCFNNTKTCTLILSVNNQKFTRNYKVLLRKILNQLLYQANGPHLPTILYKAVPYLRSMLKTLVFTLLLIFIAATRILQECDYGTYLDIATQTCKKCSEAIPMCDSCKNATYCLDCKFGYYTDLVTGMCEDCSLLLPHCSYCNNATYCLVCDNQTILENGTCKLAKKDKCGPDEYKDLETGECVACRSAIPGCIQCSNKETCTYCDTGYTLMNGKCVELEGQRRWRFCRSGYYWNQIVDECLKCPKGCAECHAPYRCFRCEKGYRLDAKTGRCKKRWWGWPKQLSSFPYIVF